MSTEIEMVAHIEKHFNVNILKNQYPIFKQALYHGSTKNDKALHKKNAETYQRLEFLGDAVLNLIISQYLYQTYPHLKEGPLSIYRSILINQKTLHFIAIKIKLSRIVIISHKLQATGITCYSKKILSDVFESLIAAIYLTQGPKETIKSILHIYKKHVNMSLILKSDNNYKGTLSQYTQRHCLPLPVYTIEKREGKPHQSLFYISISIENQLMGHGTGRNKRQAEQEAAKNALYKIKQKDKNVP